MVAVPGPTKCSPLRQLLAALILGGIVLLGAAANAGAAGSAPVSLSATILSKNQCKFQTNTAVINFGNLDPSSPVDVTTSATLDFVCRGSAALATFSFSDDDGLHETGPDANRMLHDVLPGEYLPYALELDPVNGTVAKNATQTLTVTGTLLGADYQTALAGTYADTVTITIAP